MQTTSLASNSSAHFGNQKQIITKLRATDSIVNTDKGMRVFSCDRMLTNDRAKIKYVAEFCRLKIHSLALHHEKKSTF